MSTNFTKRVLVLPRTTPSFEAARAMGEKKVGCALVSDGKGHIEGIVTDRDLACGVLGERFSPYTPISDVMAPNPKFVPEDAPITRVLEIMKKFGVRRVPVIQFMESGAQKCIGIYTLDDLILSGEISIADLATIISKQVSPATIKIIQSSKHEIRKEQVLAKFIKVIGKEIGVLHTEAMLFFLVKSTINCLPKNVAKSLIAELPSLWQEDFTIQKKGTFKAFARELEERFGVKEKEINGLLFRYWLGLEKAMRSDVLQLVWRALPPAYRSAFSNRVKKAKTKQISASIAASL